MTTYDTIKQGICKHIKHLHYKVKGLKIPRWQHRAGSSPASGTITPCFYKQYIHSSEHTLKNFSGFFSRFRTVPFSIKSIPLFSIQSFCTCFDLYSEASS